MRNIRKVKVNANVTFIMWIFEWLANVLLSVAWFIFGLRRHGTGLMVIGWYYILLPNFFLMNTPHNKDRIIDDGFKNTIRNGLRLPFNISMTTSSRVSNISTGRQMPITPATNLRISMMATNEVEPTNKHLKSTLFVISRPEQNQIQSENRNSSPLNDLGKCPSTSKGISISNRSVSDKFIQRSSTESNPDEDTNGSQNTSRSSSLTKILCLMKEHIDSEETYLYYFVQLVDVINISEHKDFKVSHPAKQYTLPTDQMLGSCGNTINNLDMNFDSHHTLVSNLILRYGLFDDVSRRIELRRELLEHFNKYCGDEKSCDKYCAGVIDFEESLIKC